MWVYNMNKRMLLFNFISIVVGNLLLAVSTEFLIIPNNIVTGGVAGLAIGLAPLLPINANLLVTLIIVICFILGYIFLGQKFALKTLLSSILYPVFINILSLVDINLTLDPLIASIYGGLLSGVGIGIVFRIGASTGGMDIPPLILSKYTRLKTHSWILIVDAFTVMLGMSTVGVNNALIGMISVWGMSYAINVVQTFGGQQAKQVFIITTHTSEVLTMIFERIDRGATIINGQGGYTMESRQVIMTVLMNEQYSRLEKMVKSIDPNAFLIVSDVTEVHGNGFYKS